MAGLEGQRLGGCVLVRPIGQGGVGEVYLAEQPELGRQVAVKVIRRALDPTASAADAAHASAAFAQEARLIASLEHPNILPIYGFGAQDGLDYLIMPYLPDGSLADLLGPGPAHRYNLPLPPIVVAGLIAQAASALQTAHDHQPAIIHGDVKPQNLLARLLPTSPSLTPGMTPGMTPAAGGSAQLLLLLADFGLARAVSGPGAGGPAPTTGTPRYTPAEQYTGQIVPQTDQYALACVAYELLTGQPVFDGDPAALYQQHSFAAPVPPRQRNPLLPPAVDPVLLRALAKAPAQRYARVDEFAQALRAALDPAGQALAGQMAAGAMAVPPPPPPGGPYPGMAAPPPGAPASYQPGPSVPLEVALPVGAPPPYGIGAPSPYPTSAPAGYQAPPSVPAGYQASPSMPYQQLAPGAYPPGAVPPPPGAVPPFPAGVLARPHPDAPGAPIPRDRQKIRRRALLGLGIAGAVVVAGGGAGGAYWYFRLRPGTTPPPPKAKHTGDTIGVYRPASSTFFLENSLAANSAFIALTFGKPNSLPLTGDWDGDGIDTIGIYEPATTKFSLTDKNQQGAPITHTFRFGQVGDIPLAGDWTGAGRDSIGVYRPSTNQFLLKKTLSNGAADFSMQLGEKGDLPVVGDWNGSGHDSVGVFRPTAQTFFLSNSVCNCAPVVAYTPVFGQKGDRPVSGDWSRTGRSGLGVFAPASSIFSLKNDATRGGPPDLNLLFGSASDIPLAGHWSSGS
ncbi:MAG TPA: protein kinase [Ktedonobacterales bacterium]|jgi:hypothetical protein